MPWPANSQVGIQRLRRALDALTESRVTPLLPDKRPNRWTRFVQRHDTWLRSPRIVGFGVGRRRRRGRYTRELVVIVYVRRKRGRKDLRWPVPRAIGIPGLGRIRTDVVGIGTFTFDAFMGPVDPVMPGCCLGPPLPFPGTLTCIVRVGGQPMVLASGHVLTNEFKLSLGVQNHPVVTNQPAGATARRLGEVTTVVVPLFNSDEKDFSNTVDAGIVRCNPGIQLDPAIRTLGLAPAGIADIQAGSVRKVGCITDTTSGQVLDADFKGHFYYPDPANPNKLRRAGYRRLVLASYAASRGDSGALVLDSANRAVGIHMGRYKDKNNVERSVFCRMILAQAQVQLGFTL